MTFQFKRLLPGLFWAICPSFAQAREGWALSPDALRTSFDNIARVEAVGLGPALLTAALVALMAWHAMRFDASARELSAFRLLPAGLALRVSFGAILILGLIGAFPAPGTMRYHAAQLIVPDASLHHATYETAIWFSTAFTALLLITGLLTRLGALLLVALTAYGAVTFGGGLAGPDGLIVLAACLLILLCDDGTAAVERLVTQKPAYVPPAAISGAAWRTAQILFGIALIWDGFIGGFLAPSVRVTLIEQSGVSILGFSSIALVQTFGAATTVAGILLILGLATRLAALMAVLVQAALAVVLGVPVGAYLHLYALGAVFALCTPSVVQTVSAPMDGRPRHA
ncbi:MAG: hypothetical protein AAGF74_01125 [Pseudomonadota bacterium]